MIGCAMAILDSDIDRSALRGIAPALIAHSETQCRNRYGDDEKKNAALP
jgi:type IV secretory pathway TraG/TraD family ATPase VirD4